MKPKLDRDTEKIMRETKISHDWVATEGYKRFKKILMTKVVESTSLLRLQALPGFTADQLLSDYGARKMLGTLLIQALTEIEGEAGSYQGNWDMLNRTEEDSLYTFLPEKVEEN